MAPEISCIRWEPAGLPSTHEIRKIANKIPIIEAIIPNHEIDAKLANAFHLVFKNPIQDQAPLTRLFKLLSASDLSLIPVSKRIQWDGTD